MKTKLILLPISIAALAVSANSQAMLRRAARVGKPLRMAAAPRVPHARMSYAKERQTAQMDKLIQPRGWNWKQHASFLDEKFAYLDKLFVANLPKYRKKMEMERKAYQEVKNNFQLPELPAHRADYRVANKYDYLCRDLAYANISPIFYMSAKDMIQTELNDMLAEQKRELRLRDDIQ